MAKILRSETSLQRRLTSIDRELGRKRISRIAVWSLAAVAVTGGLLHAFANGAFGGLIAGLVVLVLAGGYELHLRELVTESRNLEGGHRGEQKTANALAEQLADDHLILNDLVLTAGINECQVDHLILAPSGIYVMESKYWAGTLTGDIHDEQWKKSRTGRPGHAVKSPVMQNERQRKIVISLLKATVPEDRVYGMAVFTHPQVKLNITHREGKAFLLREAIRFINDRCFDPPVLTADQIQEIVEQFTRHQT